MARAGKYVALATLPNGNELVIYMGGEGETREEVRDKAVRKLQKRDVTMLPSLRVVSLTTARRDYPKALRIYEFLGGANALLLV